MHNDRIELNLWAANVPFSSSSTLSSQQLASANLKQRNQMPFSSAFHVCDRYRISTNIFVMFDRSFFFHLLLSLANAFCDNFPSVYVTWLNYLTMCLFVFFSHVTVSAAFDRFQSLNLVKSKYPIRAIISIKSDRIKSNQLLSHDIKRWVIRLLMHIKIALYKSTIYVWMKSQICHFRSYFIVWFRPSHFQCTFLRCLWCLWINFSTKLWPIQSKYQNSDHKKKQPFILFASMRIAVNRPILTLCL